MSETFEIVSKDGTNSSAMLFSKKFSDIKFKFLTEEIYAHKLILSTNSSYFAEMLDAEDVSTVLMKVENIEHFKACLEYMYSGKITAKPLLGLLDILVLARTYRLASLVNQIIKVVNDNMSVDNFPSLVEKAKSLRIETIVAHGFDMMTMLFDQMKEVDSVPAIDIKVFRILLNYRVRYRTGEFQTPGLRNLTELELFQIMRKWSVTADLTDDEVADLFGMVQLDQIPLLDLLGSVKESKIFTLDNIFQAIKKKAESGMLEEKDST
ncbi:BTBD9.2 family protein [Megaselia abdita]